MKKEIIFTKNAPEPIGPYNQAIKIGKTLYVSGQIPLIPGKMELVNGNLEKETIQVMKNLEAVLLKANMTFDNVVKTTIFLSDMDNFEIINKIYGKYFDPENAPARETVEVSNLPKYVRLEISVIASEID
ncbi:MAG: Rid family detoxifying hydrolase [Flavobacteriaceae bacterium]